MIKAIRKELSQHSHTAIVAVLLVVLYLFIDGVWRAFVPTSYWFDAKDIHIEDTVEGVPPKIEVEREIKRPFRARWLVTILFKDMNGDFFTYCWTRGENDYRPDNALPPDIDLAWWLGSRNRCHLLPGIYKVNTIWTLEIEGHEIREVRISSNEFEVGSR